MEVDPASPMGPQPYTILRIKRKRNEEPLDALGKPLIESTVRRKKRGGPDVFQFAETVEPEAWGDRSKDLQDRISALEREQALKAGAQPIHDDAPSPHPRRPDLSRQYKVVLEDTSPTPDPASSPSVIGEDKGQPEFKLYDAVLASDATSSLDPEMEKFLPLLQEYLTIHDIKPSTLRPSDSTGSLTPSGSRSAPIAVAAPAPIPPRGDPDFVWDVFYHRAGLTNEYDAAANVATLTGLPDSLADPYASASESEEEDEADEDSNAEEYYKNDYPDEESSTYDTEGSDISPDDSNDYHDWR
ncbi:hypothetical protein BJY52DRAFT_1228295 [Lactarius psammicola]|nr:hypothetical protein BJY52DRAFT_1228295 [Lactarius psammicola]